MATQSHAFRRGARTVRRQQFWRNQRILALSVFVGLVSAIFHSPLLIVACLPLALVIFVHFYRSVLWCWIEPLPWLTFRMYVSSISRLALYSYLYLRPSHESEQTIIHLIPRHWMTSAQPDPAFKMLPVPLTFLAGSITSLNFPSTRRRLY
jgi:hypothetical protein